MINYRLTRRARQDVSAIWRRIAEDSEPAGDRFVDLLVRHFRLLGDNPHAGRRRDELRRDYRSFPVGEYLIFYRILAPGVHIMRVVHGRRDLAAVIGA